MEKEQDPTPQFLNEEQMHKSYSVESAMDHFKNDVYYRQRTGGEAWFHGRVTNSYRNNYDRIFRKEI